MPAASAVSSLLEFLPQLPMKAGTIQLASFLSDGGRLETSITLSEGDLSLNLSHPAIGDLTLTRSMASLRSPSGQTFVDTAAQLDATISSLTSGLRADFTWVQNALQAANSGVAELKSALARFGAADVTVTFLVIPGLSAFNAQVGPLEFGPLQIPKIQADISLRDIAIDVSKGSFAFQLMIPDARCLADITYANGSHSYTLSGATLFLDADAVYDLGSQSGTITIRHARIDQASLSGTIVKYDPKGNPEQVAFSQVKGAALDIRNAIFDLDFTAASHVMARSGIVEVFADGGTGSFATLQAGDLGVLGGVTVQMSGLNLSAELLAPAVDSIGYRGAVVIDSATIAFTSFTPSANLPATVVDGGPIQAGDTYQALQWSVSLPSGNPTSGFVGLTRKLTSASYTASNVVVSTQGATPTKGRFTAQFAGLDRALGLQAQIANATLTFNGNAVPLTNVMFSRWEEHFAPSSADPVNVLTGRATNDIAADIGSFTIGVIPPPAPVKLPIDSQGAISELLNWFGGINLGALSGIWSKIKSIVSNPLVEIAAGWIPFGPSVDGTYLIVGIGATTVMFDSNLSNDSTLALRLQTSISQLSAEVDISYPKPELSNPFNRASTSITSPAVQFNLPLDFAILFDVSIDTMARKINIQGVKIVLLVSGAYQQAQADVEQLLLGLPGPQAIQNQIIQALHLAVSIPLPDSWDITRLQITGSNSLNPLAANVDVQLRMRAFEYDFQAF